MIKDILVSVNLFNYMTLTQEQILQVRGALGATGGIQAQPQKSSRIQRLQGIADRQLGVGGVEKPPTLTGLAKAKETFKTGFKETTEAVISGITKPQEAITGISTIRKVGPAARAAFDIGGQILGKILEVTPEFIKEPFRKKFEEISFTPQGQAVLQALSTGVEEAGEKFAELEKNSPQLASDIKDITSAAELFGFKGFSAGLQKLKIPLKAGIKKLPRVGPTIERKAVEEIAEKVKPKLTIKERRIAIEEGRVLPGKKTRLFGTKPDTVVVQGKVREAAETVNKLIPDAKNLSKFDISNRAKGLIKDLSNKLKPSLQTVKITEEAKDGVVNSWIGLKAKQAKNIGRKLSDKRFKGAQDEFEELLLELSDADNLDDVWNLRKDYDDLIPDNVKQASQTSSEGLQLEQQMWKENRRIFNGVIEDMSAGLETTAKQSFKDMSNLYLVRQNVISSGDILVKGLPGLFSTKNIIKTGIGLIGLKALGGFID